MKKNHFFNKRTERIAILAAGFFVCLLIILLIMMRLNRRPQAPEPVQSVPEAASSAPEPESAPVTPEPAPDVVTSGPVSVDPSWEYADYSMISGGEAVLYHAKPSLSRGITVCINAGHGTAGGTDVKTLCHPDGTPKVTGGTTDEGATYAVAVSTGTDLMDGTTEADANLELALLVRDRLLDDGFDVLMIREGSDVQLDNISRTLLANHYADCHIAIHYDSTDFDKGVFFMSVPSDEGYRSMEPVASHWEEHNRLGEAVVHAIEAQGMKLFEGGAMEMDLTQTSYSTVPSIDLEVGDRATDHSPETLGVLAEGILSGVSAFFGV